MDINHQLGIIFYKNLNNIMKNEKINRNPREIIFFILNEYFKKFYNLKKIINKYLSSNNYLLDIDKNFIYNVSKGVVRNYITIDFFISIFSKIKIKKIELKILNILRIAVYQSLFLDKIPNYSIVNESVNIAKKYKSINSANFVNAVLRKITSFENEKTFYFNKISEIKAPLEKTSILYSFPRWIIDYWQKYYGIDLTEKLCQSLNKNPFTYFKINTLKVKNNLKDIYDELKKINDFNIETFFNLESFRVDSNKYNLNTLIKSDLIKNGYIYVQDLSSQIAIKYFLNPNKNEKILDLCSAPGGKSISSSIMMNNSGAIIAIDNDENRLELFKKNIKNMGIKNIHILLGDIVNKKNFEDIFLKNKFLLKLFKNDNKEIKFDKIFIDAPCSAFGTIGKNPDAKYNKKLTDLYRFKENSIKILENCDKYLKVGGKIVFYTCTLSNIENKEVIENFLNLYQNKYKVENININKIFNDLNQFLSNKDDIKFNSLSDKIFEIMPFYFMSEGASICSIIKLK
jgi:16S rRNA (cytosine967-C5)-methyltransferase